MQAEDSEKEDDKRINFMRCKVLSLERRDKFMNDDSFFLEVFTEHLKTKWKNQDLRIHPTTIKLLLFLVKTQLKKVKKDRISKN